MDHNVALLTGLLGFVTAGYLLFDRTFAWIHIPGTPILVGEVHWRPGWSSSSGLPGSVASSE